jgi:hypothetical protein
MMDSLIQCFFIFQFLITWLHHKIEKKKIKDKRKTMVPSHLQRNLKWIEKGRTSVNGPTNNPLGQSGECGTL